jgi:hypothetical protein
MNDDLNHTPPPQDLEFKTALHEEHHLLEEVEVPIVTVSATYREQLGEQFYQAFPDEEEVVFSRAHYSMALGVLVAALKLGKTSWMVDPTNYVTQEKWGKIWFTHSVGRLIARHKALKELKDKVDTVARSKVPLAGAVAEPLKYLTRHVKKPIISLHYEAGNILAQEGHQIIQVVTDPHVRPQYLNPLPEINSEGNQNGQVTYCVFDEETREEFFHKAKLMGKRVTLDQVVVTGPPVDPRIVESKKLKKPDRIEHRPLRLAVTTGGLGQNKAEIKTLLDRLSHWCFGKEPGCLQLFLYAGTHRDFYEMYRDFAVYHKLRPGALTDEEAAVRILYEPNIVEANELMVEYMFPWADGVVTKPSGDMAYEAAASGCFQLFLEPWGEWEENIRRRFNHIGIGMAVKAKDFDEELKKFSKHYWEGETWFKAAQEKTLCLPKQFYEGAENIVKTAVKIT